MASLAMRHEQLSALARTKRLFWLSSVTGILSLVGVCVAVLPWRLVRRQGDWVAFAIVAASSFVWVTLPIAASGSMQLRRRLLSAWWAMMVAAAAHLALAIYLEFSLVDQKGVWIEDCSTSDLAMTADACRTRSRQVILAFPLTAAILEIGAVPLLWLLRRSFDKLPQDHTYGTLMDDDVPPGWHVPAADLAADSSASDSDDHGGPLRPGAASPRRSSRTRVGSGTDKDSASDWYELGRKSSRSLATSGMSWSEVRRARKERNLAKSRASS
ncbi:uncharacterized protein RHOBADRAFT_54143 [Rhodotorula graminis WP1]|uniref:Uncharacterized protein n=1 Tax=Rhodotorula graminis (strain WP1) TaxID=578459 RepID=A0A194S4F3_RHOGW|nr:uncharacterized protein RHOBADRAFT_54143 [Rhodotorula graminis WP1]KPV74301.1 hypothetical protein RHOBADRAFT_54143 [Rhodotorula graminis WP1]